MSGWPNYPGPMDYGQNESDLLRSEKAPPYGPKEAPFNEEQPLIDYLETRYDQDTHYNDPRDPDADDYEDFEPKYDDDDWEEETE